MTKAIEYQLEQEEDTLKNRYLTFFIDNDGYGIEITNVIEIIGIQKITKIPELPNYMKGIINLRGEIIPVMDIRLRFMKAPIEYNDRTCIIIISIEEVLIGFIVDHVAEVLTIDELDSCEPLKKSKVNSSYIKGIGKVENEVKLILDCERLLIEDEQDNTNQLFQ